MSHSSFDTIVVGLGAVGSSTLMHLARRGQRVLGIDRWNPPHDRGSSHGETRITRCAIGEGECYVPLALRSHEIWRELEARTGEELLVQCGALIMATQGGVGEVHGKPAFVPRTIAAAERFSIPHEVLDAGAIERRFPQFQLQGDELGYFEPGGGYVRPERCIAAELTVAREAGALTRTETRVVAVERDGANVRVVTDGGERFVAAEVVLAAGVWSPGFVGGTLAPRMTVMRQVLHWFTPEDASLYEPGRCPVYIWMHGSGPEDSIYGFPLAPNSSGVKIAMEQYSSSVSDPEQLVRAVTAEEGEDMVRRHIAGRFRGLTSPPVRSAVCPYTMTADGDFLITRTPENDRVLLVSACSGHGFKHSAALGEQVAAAVTGESWAGLRPFAPDAERVPAGLAAAG